MLIIPAIDLHEGRCVRLSQGRMDDATVYSDDPVETARRWEALGARRLHIVDLDGAVSGKPANAQAIARICASVSMEIEVGGGIRTMESAKRYFDTGAAYVILGTSAVRDPTFLATACAAYPGRMIIGIDALDGMVAVQGWTEATRISAVDFARGLDAGSVAAVIFTDIRRDGMLTGPNIESTEALARSISIPVIASGGVSGIADIQSLLRIENSGVIGVIIGRALYTGAVDLQDCIALASKAGISARHSALSTRH